MSASSLGDEKHASCEESISRKDFLLHVLKRGAAVGALIAAPKIIDTFLVPPAYAQPSTVGPGDKQPGSESGSTPDPPDEGPPPTAPGLD